jgi:hypothetical protein
VSVEEVKEIVYSGNAVPKGFKLPTTPQTIPVTTIHNNNSNNNINLYQSEEKPAFNMSNSIYPKKNSSSSASIKSNGSKSQVKIIKTLHHPLGGNKSGLSLREMKYGTQNLSKINESDNISVKSYSSNKSSKSVKSVNSDDFNF